MSHAIGFPPIAAANAEILILGSMPGAASLEAVEYYAHPRNAFWPIMLTLFGDGGTINLSYRRRCQLLIDHHIALWDVLQSCYRPGSLDSAIDESTITANDFSTFLAVHPNILHIFFNGQKAEQSFRRHVLMGDMDRFPAISYHRLPSTSPAMATLSRQQKVEAWRSVAECLDA